MAKILDINNTDEASVEYHFTMSYGELKKKIGKPHCLNNDGQDKTNAEWQFETEEGRAFYIYDYKLYCKIKNADIIEWHVAASNRTIALTGLRELGIIN